MRFQLDDEARSYKLYAAAACRRVFRWNQHDGLLRRMKSDYIEDIIALVALYRPARWKSRKFCEVKYRTRRTASVD
jgi:DNA polymerase III alpha subunit